MHDREDATERVIAAIFGRQEARGGHDGKESLYARLEKYASLPDESLEPAPEINELLSGLVSYLQGQFSQTPSSPSSSLPSRSSPEASGVCWAEPSPSPFAAPIQ